MPNAEYACCSKMTIAEEEAEESLGWVELLIDGGLLPEERLSDLMSEGNQLVAIMVSSIRIARKGTRTS